MRRYAEGTVVQISRSREEIQRLLTGWDCQQIQWSDDFEVGKATLRFAWTHDGQTFLARLSIKMDSLEEIRKKSGGWESKMRDLTQRRGKREHRLLLLWIKGCLNAVEEGIIRAEEVFLPWLEDKDGHTVGEMVIPRLKALPASKGLKLLEGSK